LQIANNFRAKVFASIVPKDFDRTDLPEFLRKDYVYLFERFYYFLDDHHDEQ